MYIHIQSAERLGKILSAASAAMGGKSDSNSLANAMLLQATSNELSITVVDTSSHQLNLVVPAQVSIPGAVLVPGDYFPKLALRFGNGSVQLKAEGNQLEAIVGNDKHQFALFQGEPEDFPIDASLPPIAAIVDGDGLHEALKAVMQATIDNDQEIIFQGHNDTIGVYTTDAITTRSRFQTQVLNFDFVFGIPKSVLAAGKLPQWSGPVNIHVGEGKVVFSKENEHLLIRRVFENNNIEDLDSALGLQALGKLVVSLSLLKNRVHTIAIGKIVGSVRVTGKVEKQLVIASENQGVGASRMQIPVNGEIAGTISEVKLDMNLLEKALKTIDGDDVLIDFVDYIGNGKNVSLRFANESNPEKRQTLLMCLQ
jgi:DNA polymerase III sliding clamp (beta) subunit (PCNA family)